MRDEEKSREHLIEEVRLLRELVSRLAGAPEAPGEAPAPSSVSPPVHAPTSGDPFELIFRGADAGLPEVDEIANENTAPRFLQTPLMPHPSAQSERAQRQITETGSFDLTWISLDSFGKLLHSVPMPILLVSSSGTVDFANQAFLKLGDLCTLEPGTRFESFFPTAQEAGHATMLLERLLSERKPQARVGLVRIDRQEIWSRMHMRSIRFGRARSALVLIEDLTTEKRELLLNEKYGKLVDIFPIGIAEFTLGRELPCDMPQEELITYILDATVRDGNIQYALLNGYRTVAEMKRAPFGRMVEADPKSLQFCCSWLQKSCLPSAFETKTETPDGELRYFENTLVGNVQGETIRQFWAMKQDITDRIRVREELREKIRTIDELYAHVVEAEKAKAIAEHTATVAHELRQPLAIIGGFARRMAKGKSAAGSVDAESVESTFKIITKEVLRLEKILGHLIDFTHRDETISLQRGNPNELINYVLCINEQWLTEKKIRLETDFGAEVGEIFLDPDRVQQMIRNLVANAVEATFPNGVIRVETGISVPGHKADTTGELGAESFFQMKIHNSGRHIPPKHVEKIFNPFFTTKDYGTGLGLTLTKKIVEDHRGSISVKSDDTGTLVTVWLPVRR